EALPRLRGWRNPQTHRAVQCRNLDASAKAGFMDADEQRHMEIVAFAAIHRMRLHLNRDEEIAGRSAIPAGVSMPGHAQSCSVLDARRHTNRHRFGTGAASVAEADRAAFAAPA